MTDDEAYGGGEVTIWDAGTYDLEKWREGREVIVTLHGEKHGTHRYALIHTGGRDGDDNNWLLHLMKDDAPAAKPRRKVIGGTSRKNNKPTAPMLATLGTETALGDEDDWAFEMKWDGIRAIATVEGGQVRYVSRNGIDLTVSYPELEELADAIDSDASGTLGLQNVEPFVQPPFARDTHTRTIPKGMVTTVPQQR